MDIHCVADMCMLWCWMWHELLMKIGMCYMPWRFSWIEQSARTRWLSGSYLNHQFNSRLMYTWFWVGVVCYIVRHWVLFRDAVVGDAFWVELVDADSTYSWLMGDWSIWDTDADDCTSFVAGYMHCKSDFAWNILPAVLQHYMEASKDWSIQPKINATDSCCVLLPNGAVPCWVHTMCFVADSWTDRRGCGCSSVPLVGRGLSIPVFDSHHPTWSIRHTVGDSSGNWHGADWDEGKLFYQQYMKQNIEATGKSHTLFNLWGLLARFGEVSATSWGLI